MSDIPDRISCDPVIAGRLFAHGQAAVQYYRARNPLKVEPKPGELEKLGNVSAVTLRDAIRLLPRFPLEVKLAANGYDEIKCDQEQLSALSVIFVCQIAGEETATIPHLYRIISHPKAAPELFLKFRGKVLDNIFAGLYCANEDPWISYRAVIRLAARTLFGLTGGLLSGMARWRYRRGIHYGGWDDGSEGQEGVNKNA